MTRSSLCSGVECGTKRAHNFLFPKSSFRIRRTRDLGMFKDSTIILDAIRRSFLTKSAIEAMFTPIRVDFGSQPLSSFSTTSLPSRNREYQLKSLIGSQPHSRKLFAPLIFRLRASCILGQAFHYSPENAFYIFNQQIYFII